ncbi:hypothetical protein ONS95_007018 [Cadophora gregata]|uniref:uncharacterized protein n=1 Tax=Cadophora gregata TaxID=51156 RepID=UPI0026DB2761|nr:uncharacterized protein ONS95_007018 [Cadophora gregata]KAK0100559.1 hypothetical protein ONS95_007018 [Cadophora gregata]KAK0117440.1 hypothetical protein ONS96_013271 [Cadophora gregata f. sp. sojae]
MSGRPERPSKKLRTLSTDSEGTADPIDWASTGTGATGSAAGSRGGRAEKATSGKNETSRSRRNTAENVSMATVSRGPPSGSSRSPTSMRLTVKTSSSKLREATRSSSSGNSGSSTTTNARDPFIGGQIIEGKRARNVRKSYVLESDSEEEDEDEEMEEAGDEDAEMEEDDDEDLDAEDDGLGDEDAEGDIDMEVDVPPPPPVIKVSRANGKAKEVITVKPPVVKGKVLPVEQKEMEDASDDEELSELDSDLAEEVEEEEGMQTGNEEDAEGEDEEIEVEEDGDEEDDDSLDSDDETPGGGSRASTPDLNKLTKRQRARFEESDGGHLLALPDEVQVKKHLTAEEHAMRRAEMARRRKNLSEKRNEEEKLETINKLLKKQAPKTNARRAGMTASDANNAANSTNNSAGDGEPVKPNAMFVRWVSTKEGNRIGVPEEWLDAPVGRVFDGSVKMGGGHGMGGGKLIEEVA